MIQVWELFNPLRRARGMFYGWWLVGISSLVMILGVVPLFHGMAAWFPVLEGEFGWSRGQMSVAFALTRVEGGVMGPVEGILVERLGPRRMVLIGMLILGGGLLILSQVQNLWMFYLAFIVMSMGAGLGSWLPMMTALNNWFVRRRATAISAVIVGYRLGAVSLVPLLAWAIDPDQPDRFGWRATAAGIGIIIILLAFPISRLVRNRPEDYGYRPDGEPLAAPSVTADRRPAPQPAAEDRSFTWQEAIRTRTFWLISFGHACCSIVIVTIMVHLGPLLTDRGFSLQMVGWVVSTYTAVGVVFTLVAGYVGDRAPIRLAIFGFAALQSVAVIVVLLAQDAALVFLFAVLLGIGDARSPLTTAIRSVYFGRRAFASITGMSMVPMNILLLAAPLFAGYMFDATGSYAVPFTAVAVVSFMGAGLFLLLGVPRPLSSRQKVR